jgi:hypothetical protein
MGRCPVVAVAAPDVAFHPDVSRAAESLQVEFHTVDRAIALNSSGVATAFRRARSPARNLALGLTPTEALCLASEFTLRKDSNHK